MNRSDKPPATLLFPAVPDLRKRIDDAVSQPDAIDMGNWHIFSTTHCRAGCVVHLAGREGYALEDATTPAFAAAQIYNSSGFVIDQHHFHSSNELALADMERLAYPE